MKKIPLFFSLVFLSCMSKAQDSGPIDPTKDRKEILGYTVQLIRTNDGSIGYDIMRNNKIEVHQFQNPLVFSPKGITTKEAAYSVAEWVIKEYRKSGRWATLVPPHIIRTLKIDNH
jgi:hypothetical protein